jgi:hypothetical protein
MTTKIGLAAEDKALKIIEPIKDNKLELSGRMYEACDVLKSIEDGQLKTVSDIVKHLQISVKNYSGMIKLDEWLLKIDCTYSFRASFEHAEKCGYEITSAFNPKDPDSETQLPISELNLPLWGVTALSNYLTYTNNQFEDVSLTED